MQLIEPTDFCGIVTKKSSHFDPLAFDSCNLSKSYQANFIALIATLKLHHYLNRSSKSPTLLARSLGNSSQLGDFTGSPFMSTLSHLVHRLCRLHVAEPQVYVLAMIWAFLTRFVVRSWDIGEFWWTVRGDNLISALVKREDSKVEHTLWYHHPTTLALRCAPVSTLPAMLY